MAGTPGNRVPASFWQQVLSDIGAPATAQNIAILQKWATFENTVATWNPLASEQNRIPGSVASTGINGAPAVKNYVSQTAGAAETAAEMQAIAPKVVSDLQNNKPLSQWGATEAGEVAHWGTHGFANLILGGAGSGASSGGSAVASSSPTASLSSFTTDQGTAQQEANASACLGFTEYSNANPSVIPGAQVFGWILQPCILKRTGLLILGSGLIIFGLHYLGKDKALDATRKVFVGGGRVAPNVSRPAPKAEPAAKAAPEPKPPSVVGKKVDPSFAPPPPPDAAPARKVHTPKPRTTSPSGRPAKPRDVSTVIA